MNRSVGVSVLCLILAACGSSSATSSPAVTGSPTRPPVAVATPTPGGVAFTICPSPTLDASCPIPPGQYSVAIHDAYTLTITAGWQEERAALPGDDEPTVVLSRTDDPEQRLTIDTGQTRVLLDDAGMAALVGGTEHFRSSPPVPATVGSAVGYQVDLAPTGLERVTIDGAGSYDFQAGHRYRLMALQVPMGEESGIKVIIIDAPAAGFDAFAPLATAVVQTIKFQT